VNAEPRFPRRALLLGAVGAGVSFVARSTGWPFFVTGSPVTAERLVGLLVYPDSAAALGMTYLHVVPEESNTRVLTSLLVQSLSRRGQIQHPSDGQLREFIRRASADDFDRDRTFELKGWILALTEARLCALAAASA
jgi:hypothetical protein